MKKWGVVRFYKSMDEDAVFEGGFDNRVDACKLAEQWIDEYPEWVIKVLEVTDIGGQ